MAGIMLLMLVPLGTKPDSAFWRPFLINMGSSLIAVTVIFAVSSFLRSPSNLGGVTESSITARSDEILGVMRQENQQNIQRKTDESSRQGN